MKWPEPCAWYNLTKTYLHCRAAENGQFSGGFEFSNWTKPILKGKARQASVNGWYSIESWWTRQFCGVCSITETEIGAPLRTTCENFVEALWWRRILMLPTPVACEEIDQISASMCEDFGKHPDDGQRTTDRVGAVEETTHTRRTQEMLRR